MFFFNIMPRPALGGLSEFMLSAVDGKKEESVAIVFVRAPARALAQAGDLYRYKDELTQGIPKVVFT
jgi:hypothetical protein